VRPVSTRPSVEAILTRERAEHEETVRELNEELETLRKTTADLAETLATTRRRVLEASEGELVKLALVIAERVVGTQIALDPARIVSWAKEAIATLPARDALVVALSTDLAEQLPEGVWTDVTNGRHTLEVDPSLPKGTCDVRAAVASVEVSAAARMAAVGETIGALS
jgi:flagellar biosynthesis/type III secretory pathway protein FliH